METSLVPFLALAGAALVLGNVLMYFRMREENRLSFLLTGTGIGLVSGYLLSKLLYIAGTLFYPFSVYGIAAMIRIEASEFSFFGGCLGYVLGLVIAARIFSVDRKTMMDRFAMPGCLMAALFRFGTLYLSEIGLGDFQTLGLAAVEDGSMLAFFPLAVRGPYGDWWMAVSTLECLAGVGCALYAWTKENAYAARPGELFKRTAILLCSTQMFLELIHSLSNITYFVHSEQLYCALYILIVTIIAARTIMKNQPEAHGWKWIVFAILWIAMNGIVQFMMDKPYGFLALLPENAANWVYDHLAMIGYGLILISVIGLCVNAMKTLDKAGGSLHKR